MNAIIVEDELNVRSGFVKMLNRFCPEVTILGLADSVQQGLDLLEKHTIDLLFLDINLPDGSGFDLLYQLERREFKVIFVTAYDQYALDAFKVSAADYLMKPVSPSALQTAISKISTLNEIDQQLKYEVLEDRIKAQYRQEEKIILTDSESIQLIMISDIIYCEAEGSYTSFFCANGQRIVTSSNLKEYENILIPYGFQRCHHSYLVNLEHVKSLQKADSNIVLSNDSLIPLSTRKKSILLEAIRGRYIG